MAKRFALSFAELDLTGAALGLDVRPFPLVFPAKGRDWASRLDQAAAANRAMASRRLIRQGRFVPELERALGAWSGGQVGVAVVGDVADRDVIARAGIDGRIGVLGQQHGDGVRFALGEVRDVVPWLLGLLPTCPRAVGDSMTVTLRDRADTPHRRFNEDEDFASFSYTAPIRPAIGSQAERDHRAAGALLQRPRTGGGYFLVEARGRNGRPGSRWTVNWLDTDVGRWAAYSTFDTAGAESVVYTPADLPFIARKLTEYIHSAGG